MFMQQKKLIMLNSTVFFIGLLFLSSFSNRGLIPEKNLNVSGDSTSFAPNTKDGWNILSVYINQNTHDSVEFELILKQATSAISGSKEQLVGTITNKSFLPVKDQKANYSLLPQNTWYLIIKKNGDCYLAQVKGTGIAKSNMPGNPDVFPIKVKYKNN